jgi:exopolysaccharide production protein ExoZ
VVMVGWTLSFEMLFYALFAAMLALRLRPVLWLSGLLVLMALAGTLRTEAWPAPTKLLDPLLIEFVFGMLIGVAALQKRYLPFRLALVLAGLSIAALLASQVLGGDARAIRLFIWGIPALVLLAAVVSLEDWLRTKSLAFNPITFMPITFKPITWLVALGAWSYSLYLSHGFVVDFVWVVAAKLHLAHGLLTYLIYAAAICLCVATAGAVHYAVELPMTRFLNRKYRKSATARGVSGGATAALATS